MELHTEEVAPGIWALPVRMGNGPLGFVMAYALRLDDGLLLVDLGMGSRASLASFEERLAEVGAAVPDIRGVLFTHGHLDHYGLAGTVKERSGAWLALHPAERVTAPDQGRRSTFIATFTAEAGFDLGSADFPPFTPELPLTQPDRALADGDVIDDGPWQIEVVHTPGHSPGHVCFVVRGADVVMVGDHILSRTTPHVALWPWGEADPLGDYLNSLQRMARIGDGSLGLSGHEEALSDIPGRAHEIVEHHEEQLAHVTALVGAGTDTIGAVAERMNWSRPWPDLRRMDRLMALGEASAHLRLLEVRGEITSVDGSPRRFALA